MADLFPIGIEEQIAAVKREIVMRQRVYPRRVATKQMTQKKADAEIAAALQKRQCLCRSYAPQC